MYREKPSIRSLRREIVGDSIALEKKMALLLKLVRQEERRAVHDELSRTRAKVERERG